MTQTKQGLHLSLRRLQKSFGAKPVLNGVDIEVEPGSFLAIVGKSGCGKSTLLRLIAGLEQPSAGEVVVDHAPLRGLNSAACVMFQDARLVPWKRVEENVGLGLKGHSADARRVLEHVGLLDRAHEWPAILSGGERQRVALARAIVREPRCLLLDEPLGALDALTRLEMQRLLEQLWLEQGFTAVLITHDVEEALALADRVVLIEHGRIALDVAVPLARPRQRGSAAFAELKETVLSRVMGWSGRGTGGPDVIVHAASSEPTYAVDR